VTVRALVPIKALDEAKSRLADALPPRQRRWLVLGMLLHVLDTLKRAEAIDEIVLLGPAGAPRVAGVRTMTDVGEGLNADLTRAVARLGDTRLWLVLAADLPDLAVADVAALLAATAAHGVAIAPDHRGDGTNALGVRPPASVGFAFGAGSRARHAALAGAGHVIIQRPGLAFDVDDRDGLCRLPAARRTALIRAGAAQDRVSG
jgi:2-phospho-L-lactate guanylyltransferase